jgi:transposase
LEEPRGGQERKQDSEELMIRMLIVGYCYGIRFERRLCEEVELHVSTNSRVKLLRNDYATFLSRRRGAGDYNSSGRQRLYSALQANSRV